MADPRIEFVDVNGCKVRVLRKGSGQPLVFLHGARGGGVWMPFMEALAQHFDVVAPEHPGFGASDTPPWLDSISDMAFYYLDFLKVMGLSKVHLVGNSLGGWIALETAVRSCERVASLSVVSPAGLYVKGRPPADIFLWSAEKLTRNLFVSKEIVEAALKVTPTEEQVREQIKNNFTVAKLAWNPRFHNPDLRKWLHRIDVPCLVLWGDQDRLAPVEYAAEFERLLPDAKVRIIKQCGHLPQVEKMAEFVEAVSEFVKERV